MLNTDNIFCSNAQLLETDITRIRLLEDRVLIEDLGEKETEGSIVIPETAAERGVGKNGLLRLGRIIAAGPGDRFVVTGFDPDSGVKRRAITIPCPECEERGKFFDIRLYEYAPCPLCNGTGRVPHCVPPQCQVGDVVVYDRRREAEVYFAGKRYALVNAEQSVLAVVESGAAAG